MTKRKIDQNAAPKDPRRAARATHSGTPTASNTPTADTQSNTTVDVSSSRPSKRAMVKAAMMQFTEAAATRATAAMTTGDAPDLHTLDDR